MNLLGVPVTRNGKRTVVDSPLKTIAEYFGEEAFKMTISENIRVEEARNAYPLLWEYGSKCKVALAYRELAKEVVRCLNMWGKSLRPRKNPR